MSFNVSCEVTKLTKSFRLVPHGPEVDTMAISLIHPTVRIELLTSLKPLHHTVYTQMAILSCVCPLVYDKAPDLLNTTPHCVHSYIISPPHVFNCIGRLLEATSNDNVPGLIQNYLDCSDR